MAYPDICNLSFENGHPTFWQGGTFPCRLKIRRNPPNSHAELISIPVHVGLDENAVANLAAQELKRPSRAKPHPFPRSKINPRQAFFRRLTRKLRATTATLAGATHHPSGHHHGEMLLGPPPNQYPPLVTPDYTICLYRPLANAPTAELLKSLSYHLAVPSFPLIYSEDNKKAALGSPHPQAQVTGTPLPLSVARRVSRLASSMQLVRQFSSTQPQENFCHS